MSLCSGYVVESSRLSSREFLLGELFDQYSLLEMDELLHGVLVLVLFIEYDIEGTDTCWVKLAFDGGVLIVKVDQW
jgi:hypothetical protein